MSDNCLIKKGKVLEMVPFSESTLRRLIKSGHFPESYKLTPDGRRVAWKKAEVDQWINNLERAQGL